MLNRLPRTILFLLILLPCLVFVTEPIEDFAGVCTRRNSCRIRLFPWREPFRPLEKAPLVLGRMVDASLKWMSGWRPAPKEATQKYGAALNAKLDPLIHRLQLLLKQGKA